MIKNKINSKTVGVLSWALGLSAFIVLTQILTYNFKSNFIEYGQSLNDGVLFRYMGDAWVNKGLILYKDIFDHKGPLLFLIQGIIAKLSPYPDMNIFRVALILNMSLSVLLGYQTCRIKLNRTLSILITTMAFLCCKVAYTGNTCEEFILPFLMLILFLVFKSTQDKSYLKGFKYYFICFTVGISISSIALIRPNNALPPMIYLLTLCYLLRNDLKQLFKGVGVALIGGILPIACFSLYFYMVGAFPEFMDGWIFFSVNYTKIQSDLHMGTEIVNNLYLYITPIFMGILAWIYYMLNKKELKNQYGYLALTSIGYTIVSIFICVIGNGGGRYWLVLIPCYLLSGILIADAINQQKLNYKKIWLCILIIGPLLISNFVSNLQTTLVAIDILTVERKELNISSIQDIKNAATYIKNDPSHKKTFAYVVSPVLYWELNSLPTLRYWTFQDGWAVTDPNVCDTIADHVESSTNIFFVIYEGEVIKNCQKLKDIIDNTYTKVTKFGTVLVYERR